MPLVALAVQFFRVLRVISGFLRRAAAHDAPDVRCPENAAPRHESPGVMLFAEICPSN